MNRRRFSWYLRLRNCINDLKNFTNQQINFKLVHDKRARMSSVKPAGEGGAWWIGGVSRPKSGGDQKSEEDPSCNPSVSPCGCPCSAQEQTQSPFCRHNQPRYTCKRGRDGGAGCVFKLKVTFGAVSMAEEACTCLLVAASRSLRN